MCSFYARRSQKGKKESQLKQLFALSGSAGVKAERKHIDEINSRKEALFEGVGVGLILLVNNAVTSILQEVAHEKKTPFIAMKGKIRRQKITLLRKLIENANISNWM